MTIIRADAASAWRLRARYDRLCGFDKATWAWECLRRSLGREAIMPDYTRWTMLRAAPPLCVLTIGRRGMRCRPSGQGLLLRRMLKKALLIEALRWQSVGKNGAVAGLLNGLRDPALARALQAIHADVRAKWTVARLARSARHFADGWIVRPADVPERRSLRWMTSIDADGTI